MAINTKEKIFQASKKLWFDKGYENTTMRDIAAQCDMAIGNLTYYYPKKDDILMVYHDRILDASMRASDEYPLDGAAAWIAVEYSFLSYIASNPKISELFRQVINSAALRLKYIYSHNSLYCKYVKSNNSLQAASVMSSLVFGMMQMHYLNNDFEMNFRKIIKVHHYFLNAPDYSLECLEPGISAGRELLNKMPADL